MGGTAVGFGVVGCGVVADYHIGGVLASDGARLVAVSDIVEERTRSVGEQHGVDWHTEYREMLERPDIDVICVTTPSGIRIPKNRSM